MTIEKKENTSILNGVEKKLEGLTNPKVKDVNFDTTGNLVGKENDDLSAELLDFDESMLIPVEQITYVGGPIPADAEFIKGVPTRGTVNNLSTIDTSKAGEKTVQLKVVVGGKEYFKTSKLKILTPEKYFDQKSKIEKVNVIKDDPAPTAGEFIKDMPKDWKAEYVINPKTNNKGEQDVQVKITTDTGISFLKTVKLSVHENSEFNESKLTPVEQITYVGGAIPTDKEFIKGVPNGGTVNNLSTIDTSKAGERNVQLKIEVGGNEYFKTSKLKVLTPEKYFDQKAKLEKVSVLKGEPAPTVGEFIKDMPKDWKAEYVISKIDTSKEGEQDILLKITTDKGTSFTKTVKLSVV